MDSLSHAEAIEQVVTGATPFLKYAVETVPAGLKPSPANPDLRREAYVAFQKAAIRTASHTAYVIALASIARRPIVFAGVWGAVGRLVDEMATAEGVVAEMLGALAEVRIVGNPAPRAKAEEILSILLKMQETVPNALRKADREAKQAQFDQWQKRFGLAQKEFAEIVREDLKYAGKVREHWWQLWRPKQREPWPGGWPGPKLELEPAAGGASPNESPVTPSVSA